MLMMMTILEMMMEVMVMNDNHYFKDNINYGDHADDEIYCNQR